MGTTSFTLGPHWEKFVREEVASGRYETASEVLRAGLRELEERKKRLEALRAHLDEGLEDIRRGDVVEFDIDDILARSDKRAAARAKRAPSK